MYNPTFDLADHSDAIDKEMKDYKLPYTIFRNVLRVDFTSEIDGGMFNVYFGQYENDDQCHVQKVRCTRRHDSQEVSNMIIDLAWLAHEIRERINNPRYFELSGM